MLQISNVAEFLVLRVLFVQAELTRKLEDSSHYEQVHQETLYEDLEYPQHNPPVGCPDSVDTYKKDNGWSVDPCLL